MNINKGFFWYPKSLPPGFTSGIYVDLKKYTKEEIVESWKKAKEREQQIEQEQECTYTILMNKGIDTFKYEELGDRSLDYIYRDMAPEYTRVYDRTIFSAYLWLGISRMDSWMSKQIQLREKCKYSPEILAKMIRCNYHLHNVIKTNLLDNLKNYSGYDGMKDVQIRT